MIDALFVKDANCPPSTRQSSSSMNVAVESNTVRYDVPPAFQSLFIFHAASAPLLSIDKNIVMVTNSTLFATLKTVAYMWKQDKANKNAIEIARQAGSLYDKFQSFSEDLIKVGNNLNTTKNTYEDAMKKLTDGKDNLVRKTERLRELGAKTSKKINPKLVDKSIRDITKNHTVSDFNLINQNDRNI